MTDTDIFQVNQDLCKFLRNDCLPWNNMPSIRRLVIKAIEMFGRFLIWIVDPILRWLYDGCHRRLPHVTDPLLMKSAVELGRMIRAKEVNFVSILKHAVLSILIKVGSISTLLCCLLDLCNPDLWFCVIVIVVCILMSSWWASDEPQMLPSSNLISGRQKGSVAMWKIYILDPIRWCCLAYPIAKDERQQLLDIARSALGQPSLAYLIEMVLQRNEFINGNKHMT